MANKLLPKVSIIIPYKIDRGWLNEAIESVYNQTYRGQIELIESQSDGSVSHNINEGVKIATGEYIKYLCDDDKLTQNSIEDSIRTIKGYDFIHGDAINLFPTYQHVQKPRVLNPTLKDMLTNNVIHGGTLMYRKDVFDRIGGFDESLICAEEYEFNMRAMSKGLKLNYCPYPLYVYRRHDAQKSLGKGIDQVARALRIQAIKDRFL